MCPLQGEVDASILLVFGQYARLENISLDGKFLQTEKFTVAGVETVHEAGQPVGNLMQSWRALRQSQPGAISRLKVWQSPTATVDGVVYSWMQAEEAARFPIMLRVVDSLRTCWTEQAMMGQLCLPVHPGLCASELHTAVSGDRYRLQPASQGSSEELAHVGAGSSNVL